MKYQSRWVVGGAMGVLSLAGLFLASHASERAFYWTGLFFFAAGVVAIFNIIRRAFDEAEGKDPEHPALVPAMLLLVAVGSVVFHLLSPWWWPPIASNWGYIDHTINLTFWITGFVFVAVILFMAYCVHRFRHRDGNRAAYEPESKKLEVVLSVVTAIGVAAMLAPGLFVWHRFIDVPKDAAEVEVVGQQWQWSFRLPGEDGVLGTTSPRNVDADNPLGLNPEDPNGRDDLVVEASDLHLERGKPVKLLLRSIDVLHSFYVPEFRAKMDLVPGMVTHVWLTPSRTGQFQILCAELCGVGHALMRGGVVVDETGAHQAWLKELQDSARLAAAKRREKLTSLTPAEAGQAQGDKKQ